jgi:hypothetical protein
MEASSLSLAGREGEERMVYNFLCCGSGGWRCERAGVVSYRSEISMASLPLTIPTEGQLL